MLPYIAYMDPMGYNTCIIYIYMILYMLHRNIYQHSGHGIILRAMLVDIPWSIWDIIDIDMEMNQLWIIYL